jgi:hypothetical protein
MPELENINAELAEHERRMASVAALKAEIDDIRIGYRDEKLTEKRLARLNERLHAVKIKLRALT